LRGDLFSRPGESLPQRIPYLEQSLAHWLKQLLTNQEIGDLLGLLRRAYTQPANIGQADTLTS